MKLSVVIVDYNGKGELEDCFRSVSNQQGVDFKVTVVDNSVDNVGYINGVLKGMDKSCEYVMGLNYDVVMVEGCLKKLVDFMDTVSIAGVIMPRVMLQGSCSKINTVESKIHLSGINFCGKLGEKWNGDIQPQNIVGISGCCFLIRRELLEKASPILSDCFMGNDDVVLSWLVRLMGYEIYCVPSAVVYHKYTLKMNPRKFYEIEKNRVRLLLEAWSISSLLLLSPMLLSIEGMIWAYSLLKGSEYMKLKLMSYKDLNLKLIRARRRQVRAIRVVSDFHMMRVLKKRLEIRQLLGVSVKKRGGE